jgi:hypothetical protein
MMPMPSTKVTLSGTGLGVLLQKVDTKNLVTKKVFLDQRMGLPKVVDQIHIQPVDSSVLVGRWALQMYDYYTTVSIV